MKEEMIHTKKNRGSGVPVITINSEIPLPSKI